MKNNEKTVVAALSCTFAVVAYLIAKSAIAGEAAKSASIQTTSRSELASIDQILAQIHHCNKTITIRSQSLSS